MGNYVLFGYVLFDDYKFQQYRVCYFYVYVYFTYIAHITYYKSIQWHFTLEMKQYNILTFTADIVVCYCSIIFLIILAWTKGRNKLTEQYFFQDQDFSAT